jgi:hypothetical protein
MSLDEFKPVKCVACGEVKREILRWREVLQHRLRAAITANLDREAWLCLGCGRQVTITGDLVPPEDPGRLNDHDISLLRRIS